MVVPFFPRSDADVQDLHPRQGVPVSNLAAVLLATLERTDGDLWSPLVPDDLPHHRGARDVGRTELDSLRVRDQKDAVERDIAAGLLPEVRQDVFLLRRHP